jgi:Na+/proline symporter
MVAALFWRGSTKWGALASTVWVACAVAAVAYFQQAVAAPAPGPPQVVWSLGATDVLARTPSGTAVFGFMPVVPMVLVSALLMIVVSLATRKPSPETVARYFSKA